MNNNSCLINNMNSSEITLALEEIKFCSNLTSLNITYNSLKYIHVHAITNIIKNNNSIISLNLSWNNLGYENIKIIVDVLISHTNLTYLNLEGNKLNDECTDSITCLLSKNHTLKHLNISWNNIGNKSIKKIADNLKSNCRLTHLDLGNNSFSNPEEIAKALSTNTGLVYLNICNCHFTRKFITMLANSFKSNHSLTSLDISSNNIGNEETKLLIKGLKYSSTLTSLNFSKNRISHASVFLIKNYIKENHSIISFNIQENLLNKEDTQLIKNAFEKNISNKMLSTITTLQQGFFQKNSVINKLFPEILCNIVIELFSNFEQYDQDKIKDIFYFIQKVIQNIITIRNKVFKRESMRKIDQHIENMNSISIRNFFLFSPNAKIDAFIKLKKLIHDSDDNECQSIIEKWEKENIEILKENRNILSILHNETTSSSNLIESLGKGSVSPRY